MKQETLTQENTKKNTKKTQVAPDKPRKQKCEYDLEEPSKEKISRTVLYFNIDPEPFSTRDRSVSGDNFIETELAGKLCCQICFCVSSEI